MSTAVLASSLTINEIPTVSRSLTRSPSTLLMLLPGTAPPTSLALSPIVRLRARCVRPSLRCFLAVLDRSAPRSIRSSLVPGGDAPSPSPRCPSPQYSLAVTSLYWIARLRARSRPSRRCSLAVASLYLLLFAAGCSGRGTESVQAQLVEDRGLLEPDLGQGAAEGGRPDCRHAEQRLERLGRLPRGRVPALDPAPDEFAIVLAVRRVIEHVGDQRPGPPQRAGGIRLRRRDQDGGDHVAVGRREAAEETNPRQLTEQRVEAQVDGQDDLHP